MQKRLRVARPATTPTTSTAAALAPTAHHVTRPPRGRMPPSSTRSFQSITARADPAHALPATRSRPTTSRTLATDVMNTRRHACKPNIAARCARKIWTNVLLAMGVVAARVANAESATVKNVVAEMASADVACCSCCHALIDCDMLGTRRRATPPRQTAAPHPMSAPLRLRPRK